MGMNFGFSDVPERTAALANTGSSNRVSIREQIKYEISRIEQTLAAKHEMLKLLDDNPAIERFIDLQRNY